MGKRGTIELIRKLFSKEKIIWLCTFDVAMKGEIVPYDSVKISFFCSKCL